MPGATKVQSKIRSCPSWFHLTQLSSEFSRSQTAWEVWRPAWLSSGNCEGENWIKQFINEPMGELCRRQEQTFRTKVEEIPSKTESNYMCKTESDRLAEICLTAEISNKTFIFNITRLPQTPRSHGDRSARAPLGATEWSSANNSSLAELNGTLLSHVITQFTPPTWQDKQRGQAAAEQPSPSCQSRRNCQMDGETATSRDEYMKLLSVCITTCQWLTGASNDAANN